MCKQDKQIILSETYNAQISYCKGCKLHSVVFNSCTMSFNPNELSKFKNVVNTLKDSDFHYCFMGQDHAIVTNGKGAVALNLTKKQAKTLSYLLEEATTVMEIFSIIY